MLLERDEALTALGDALERVRSRGDGAVLAVAGEAGIGKTSVVRTWVADLGRTTVWWGMCDNLRAPRPLGPLVDIAGTAVPALAEAMSAGGSRAAVFAATLDALRAEPDGVVFVLEDLHWADDATLDLLRYLGRRLAAVPVLLVVTYRDDEVGPTHPLRQALGDLPSHAPVDRLRLTPLSVDGVTTLVADSGVDAAELRRLTGGNPFFVTEAVAAGGDHRAASVRDAVLARLAPLSAAGRAALDAAAIHPHPPAVDVVARLAEGHEGIDECVERGLLVERHGTLAFRHELARLTVEDALPPGRRQALHRAAMEALPTGAAPAEWAYHALGAGDVDAVLVHAPAAAAAAARVGAHRSAHEHLTTALPHAGRLDAAGAAALFAQHAGEAQLIGEHEAAVRSLRQAVERWAEAGDDLRRGEALAGLASPLVMLGRTAEAEQANVEAVAVLERLSPGPELARALTGAVNLRMLARELDAALLAGTRALSVVEAHGDDAQRSHALIQVGVAAFMGPDPEGGRARIEEGIALGQRIGAPEAVAVGLRQLGTGSGEMRRYAIAVPALERGVAVAAEHDLDSHGSYMEAWLARCELAIGQWDAAGRRAEALVARPSCNGVARATALSVLGLLRGRRGDPGAWGVLDDALAIAQESAHLQRLWPVAAIRAEVAWLEGRLEDELELLAGTRRLAIGLESVWAVEELAWWAQVAGQAVDVEGLGATPFGLQATGRWGDAVVEWELIGSPYEAAAARLAAGDAPMARAAFSALAELGAGPLLDRAARALQAMGERVPRRASRATRSNPFALTGRELDVLALLAEDRTNAEIAEALYISAKTVDHHVSSILAKLQVPNRRDAARQARRLGIVRP